jgi:hypothetical protein
VPPETDSGSRGNDLNVRDPSNDLKPHLLPACSGCQSVSAGPDSCTGLSGRLAIGAARTTKGGLIGISNSCVARPWGTVKWRGGAARARRHRFRRRGLGRRGRGLPGPRPFRRLLHALTLFPICQGAAHSIPVTE